MAIYLLKKNKVNEIQLGVVYFVISEVQNRSK